MMVSGQVLLAVAVIGNLPIGNLLIGDLRSLVVRYYIPPRSMSSRVRVRVVVGVGVGANGLP